jgi:hypothetical protein
VIIHADRARLGAPLHQRKTYDGAERRRGERPIMEHELTPRLRARSLRVRRSRRWLQRAAMAGTCAMTATLLSCNSSSSLPSVLPLDPIGFASLKDFSALRSSSDNTDLASNDDSKRPIPGETVVLADLEGPGVISHIWLTVAGNEYGWPRLLRLRVYYDGSDVPSVDAPVGDFFGVGHGLERPLNSVVIRNSSSGRSRNSYWPMPFRKSVRVTITNEGERRLYNLYYHVDWQKYDALPRNTGYFHARYRQALPARAGAPYDILTTKGRGFYVGTVLNAIQVQPGWFGEGDDMWYIDGKSRADIMGTGTEDYALDAWSFRVGDGPYSGVTVADGTDTGARMTAYRWHLIDPVPWKSSIHFVIEHTGWTYNQDGTVRSASEERPDLFSSVAFWYQQGIAQDQPEPPYGAARLPQGNATQIEIERNVAEAKLRGGTTEVQKEVFWGKDLLFFKATGPGSSIELPVDIPADGRYELLAQVGEAPDYGKYTVLIDGKAPNASGQLEHEPGANTGSVAAIDGYFSEVFVGEDRVIAWPTLTKGRHWVTFTCVGRNSLSTGYNLGLDGLVLSRVAGSMGFTTKDSATAADPADRLRRIGARRGGARSEMKALTEGLKHPNPDVRVAAAWAFTQMGRDASGATDALATAMSDSSPVVRGLAAIALRDVNDVSDAIADTLASHLADPDENVRMVTANALAGHPTAAKREMPKLIAAAGRPDHRHVLRSVALALGSIGPDAKDALPVLRELEKTPLIRWQAQWSLRKIEGKE